VVLSSADPGELSGRKPERRHSVMTADDCHEYDKEREPFHGVTDRTGYEIA
jgi:hypothetical protein